MRLLRPVVSIVLLAILLLIIDIGEVVSIVTRLDSALFGAALVLFALSIVAAVWKWRLCLPAIPYRALFRSYLSSLFFFLLPTGMLGAEASKLTLARRHRVQVSTVAGSIVLDKLSGLAALMALGAMSGAFAAHALALPAAVALLAGMLAIVVLLAAARAGAGGGKVAALLRDALSVVAIPDVVPKSLLAGLVAQGLMIAIYACLATGLGIVYPLPEFVVCVVVANLAAILPVSIGGIGVRELGLVALLSEIGVGAEAATALALAVLLVFMIGALAGFVNELLPRSSVQ